MARSRKITVELLEDNNPRGAKRLSFGVGALDSNHALVTVLGREQVSRYKEENELRQPAVYLLLDSLYEPRKIYVGETRHFYKRFNTHRNDKGKEFCRFVIILTNKRKPSFTSDHRYYLEHVVYEHLLNNPATKSFIVQKKPSGEPSINYDDRLALDKIFKDYQHLLALLNVSFFEVNTQIAKPLRQISPKTSTNRRLIKAKTSSFKNMALLVLRESQKPLHFREITERAIKKGLRTTGKTPWHNMNSAISQDIKSNPKQTPFEKEQGGIFSLRKNSQLPVAKKRSTAKLSVNPDKAVGRWQIRMQGGKYVAKLFSPDGVRFTLLKGSHVKTKPVPRLLVTKPVQANFRKSWLKDNSRSFDDQVSITLKDREFKNRSEVAKFVLGYANVNAWTTIVNDKGQTLDEIVRS